MIEEHLKSKATFIIAEVGINHNGSLKNAKRLIDVAAKSAADVVKFQTFVSTMYYENCEEREAYLQKPYADVKEYLRHAQDFLIRTFIETR